MNKNKKTGWILIGVSIFLIILTLSYFKILQYLLASLALADVHSDTRPGIRFFAGFRSIVSFLGSIALFIGIPSGIYFLVKKPFK